ENWPNHIFDLAYIVTALLLLTTRQPKVAGFAFGLLSLAWLTIAFWANDLDNGLPGAQLSIVATLAALAAQLCVAVAVVPRPAAWRTRGPLLLAAAAVVTAVGIAICVLPTGPHVLGFELSAPVRTFTAIACVAALPIALVAVARPVVTMVVLGWLGGGVQVAVTLSRYAWSDSGDSDARHTALWMWLFLVALGLGTAALRRLDRPEAV
ncbi:MAG TPA: hypothetical protein VFE14_14960, partial [Micromonosporaceae bacterium]|nr:hypothetical protein [Micromonosporaceae bacterium]